MGHNAHAPYSPDNDFEVFIDVSGTTQYYVEFEMSLQNATYDIKWGKPDQACDCEHRLEPASSSHRILTQPDSSITFVTRRRCCATPRAPAPDGPRCRHASTPPLAGTPAVALEDNVTYSLTHALIHSCTHAFTHSRTHSLTHTLSLTRYAGNWTMASKLHPGPTVGLRETTPALRKATLTPPSRGTTAWYAAYPPNPNPDPDPNPNPNPDPNQAR